MNQADIKALIDRRIVPLSEYGGHKLQLVGRGDGTYFMFVGDNYHELPNWTAVSILLDEMGVEWSTTRTKTTSSA